MTFKNSTPTCKAVAPALCWRTAPWCIARRCAIVITLGRDDDVVGLEIECQLVIAQERTAAGAITVVVDGVGPMGPLPGSETTIFGC
jgi:hypothetical protein